MKRPYALTLYAASLPSVCVCNLRKMHFAGGLGDGNVVNADTHEGLRGGAGNKARKRKGTDRFDVSKHHNDVDITSRFRHNNNNGAKLHEQSPRHEHDLQRIDELSDADLIDYLRRGQAERRAAAKEETSLHHHHHEEVEAPSDQHLSADGPWQLTVLMLFGIMGVLLGLFVHFSTDPTAHSSYFRRRMKKKKHYFHSPSYKKKTDEWSEDEEVTEDDNYRGDTEGTAGGGSSIAVKKRASPVPKSPNDPTANLYYQVNPSESFRQQESRLRKSVTQQQQSANNVGDRSPQLPSFHSPTRPNNRSAFASSSSSNIDRKVDKASSFPQPPFLTDRSGLGSGLEGFTSEHSSVGVDMSVDMSNNAPAVNKSPIVRPMGTFTPTESFASMSSGVADEQSNMANSNNNHTLKSTTKVVGIVDFNTTPPIRDEAKNFALPTSSPSWHSGDYTSQYSKELAELPTPRIDHTRGKRDLSKVMKNHKISGVPLTPSLSSDADDRPQSYRNQTETTKIDNLAAAFPGMPLVPNLSHDGDDGTPGGSPCSGHHIDAPRSVLLEELQLVRMESGVSGPRWRTKYESASIEDQQKQEDENLKKLRESSTVVDPAEDPRNSIQHIRKDLTISSDASSSLSSRVTFSELKLEDVIGGGGFGQVWRAKWKGTPVAVKVLTGSAQAETVPKAVLEEFIAEINMVSGMRHPNICLFMGACLDPPNRAIVTELCENGSLWDALRSPLTTYQVADGKTRLAWPLDVYEPMTAPPPTFKGGQCNALNNIEPPLAPKGAWPWVLVKRVASGTARGMCYLHSGNPPVLHRDLKSANILLDESYTAKLADFGLSRLKAVRSGMTGNCGTVQWMAPEVLSNEDYAEPADVFR